MVRASSLISLRSCWTSSSRPLESSSVNSNVITLSNKLETLTDHLRTEQTLMKSLAETQMEMKPILAKIAEGSSAAGMDESTRSHIRNLDVYLTRLTEELSSGRENVVQQLRSEIKLLARTIAASKVLRSTTTSSHSATSWKP